MKHQMVNMNDVIFKKILIMFNLLREQDKQGQQKEYQNILSQKLTATYQYFGNRF
ncbi:unnamed protein product [Paramecium pentaurelia]|uniref:Uncharacterized protein n=1 Tax=Paramecium pentaurelia TaxID=43138 RepID=A0A8S1XJE8_9CILI|nr:unnamed protein product [Paramecium pentaurelia]